VDGAFDPSLELRAVRMTRSSGRGRAAAAREVVRGVDLRLVPGKVIALLGPNGAGKTSLLGLASGRYAPSSGRATLEGRELSRWEGGAIARRIAFLPQVERLPYNYSCLELVLLGRAPHVPYLSMPSGRDAAVAAAALARLGLAGFEDRPAGELSGGELQLARIARCLAQEARYLLLDEPTSMLDPANARRVADALKGLAGRGAAAAGGEEGAAEAAGADGGTAPHGVLFATHDVALAAYLADEAVLLREGEVVADGAARDVLVPERLREAFGVAFGPSSIASAFGEV